MDHPYSEPTTVPLSPTKNPSETSNWNKPSTSRGASYDQGLDLVKGLQAEIKHHEQQEKEKDKIIQRLLQQQKKDRHEMHKLKCQLFYERGKFKSLKDRQLSKTDRENIIKECLKPFFKPTQIGNLKIHTSLLDSF